jgi:hypothetical protein
LPALTNIAETTFQLELNQASIFQEVDSAPVAPLCMVLQVPASRTTELKGGVAADAETHGVGILMLAFRADHQF